MKHRRVISHETRAVAPILGKNFAVYTLHAPDPRGGDDQVNTQEGWYTVTLSAIPGLHHREPATLIVELT